MTVVVERPPEACSELRGGMRIIGHDQMLIADSQATHNLGETCRWSDLRLHGRIRVHNIAAPINVDSTGNMLLLILFTRPDIVRHLKAFTMFAIPFHGTNI